MNTEKLFIATLCVIKSNRIDCHYEHGVLFDILSIENWYNRPGQTNVILEQNIPNYLGYMYHHLCGALLLSLGKIDSALEILDQSFWKSDAYGSYSVVNGYTIHGLTAWPHLPVDNCFSVHAHLLSQFNDIEWLDLFFNNASEYRNYINGINYRYESDPSKKLNYFVKS